jgi:hypothetical protein
MQLAGSVKRAANCSTMTWEDGEAPEVLSSAHVLMQGIIAYLAAILRNCPPCFQESGGTPRQIPDS